MHPSMIANLLTSHETLMEVHQKAKKGCSLMAYDPFVDKTYIKIVWLII
jgi:hypothetical protein